MVHASWGLGQGLRYDDDKMLVLFDAVGYRTLGVEIVTTERLPRLVG